MKSAYLALVQKRDKLLSNTKKINTNGLGCVIVTVLFVAVVAMMTRLPENPSGGFLGFSFWVLIFIGVILWGRRGNEKEKERHRLRSEKRQLECYELRERKQALEESKQEILSSCRVRARELIEPHIATLSKKKKRLITLGDYGEPCTDKWLKEINYFYDLVLRTDTVLLSIESEYEIQTPLFDQSVFSEETKDSLVRYVDELVDIEVGNFVNDLPEYSDDITPEEYENFCADILNYAGWVAVVTKGSGDQGIDVIAEKDDFRLAIQCKKYSKPVGNKAVQEAYSGGAFYEADASAVVAPIAYTSSAKELANSLGVRLLHHEDLSSVCVAPAEE